MDGMGTVPPALRAGYTHNVGNGERWASLIGGGLITLFGIRRGGGGGLFMGALGGMLIYRGASGHSPLYRRLGISTVDPGEGRLLGSRGEPVRLRAAITIDRSADDLYRFWRRFTDLPRIMPFLAEVSSGGGDHSHWVARLPTGGTLEWDSEVVDDQPNQRISWRSTGQADIANWGEVRFKAAPSGRGTEVQLELDYRPPAGKAGALAGRFMKGLSEAMVQEDLRRFKHLMETGEIPTNDMTLH